MLANGRWDSTLILLMWRIWWAPNNASKWQMGFNSAFKGLIFYYVTSTSWCFYLKKVTECDLVEYKNVSLLSFPLHFPTSVCTLFPHSYFTLYKNWANLFLILCSYKSWSSFCMSFIRDRGSTVVKVLCYKLEDRWFDPSWCHWNFSLT